MSIDELYPSGTWPPRLTWPQRSGSAIPGYLMVFPCPVIGSFFEATLWGPDGQFAMFVLGKDQGCGTCEVLWFRADPPPWDEERIPRSLSSAMHRSPDADHLEAPEFAAYAKRRSSRRRHWLIAELLGDGSGGEVIRRALMAHELRAQ